MQIPRGNGKLVNFTFVLTVLGVCARFFNCRISRTKSRKYKNATNK